MGARSRFGAATSASNRLNSSLHRCAYPLGSWLPCALRPSTHRIGCNPVRGPFRSVHNGQRWPRRTAALVVDEVAQVSAGASQALAKVVGSDLQELRGYGVAYTEDGTADEGQPLLTVKAKQHSRGTGEHRLGH